MFYINFDNHFKEGEPIFGIQLASDSLQTDSQATEAIVDVALAENRRFAVVPCCVFAERFRQRELSPGGGLGQLVI